jgi:hypothetical protein
MWYIYIGEYYSVIKKNIVMSFMGKQMGLETIMLREISQTEKNNLYIYLHAYTYVHINVYI